MSATIEPHGYDFDLMAWCIRRCRRDPRLTGPHQIVLFWITVHANHGCAMAHPSFDLLARLTHMARPRVIKLVHDMAEWGLFRVELHGRKNQYYLKGDGITTPKVKGGNGSRREPSIVHSMNHGSAPYSSASEPYSEATSSAGEPVQLVNHNSSRGEPLCTRERFSRSVGNSSPAELELKKKTKTTPEAAASPVREASSPQPPNGAGDETSPPTSPEDDLAAAAQRLAEANVVPFDRSSSDPFNAWVDNEASGKQRVSPPRPRSMPLDAPQSVLRGPEHQLAAKGEPDPAVIHQLVLEATRSLRVASHQPAPVLDRQEQLDHLAPPPVVAHHLNASDLAAAREAVAQRLRANGLTSP